MRALNVVYTAIALAISGAFTALAQDVPNDGYAARDICVGVAAQFGNAKGLTFNAGKFKVNKETDGQITIFENNVQVGQIPNFDYSNYTTCIEKTMKLLIDSRKP